MYLINDKYLNNNRMLDKTELMDIEGFNVSSKHKTYKIDGCEVKSIIISSRRLANNIVYPLVQDKYKRLIDYLTTILIDDDGDDSGDSYREALNRIEKFRLMIKNKYRNYLTRKELEKMASQLVVLQKELNRKLLEIHNSYVESLSEEHKRSR